MIVLIPAYEPDKKLLTLVGDLQALGYTLIVVDDGSSDSTQGIFSALPEGVTLLRHPVNKGKGRAIKTGCEYIAAHFPLEEGIVTVDADGQHLPQDIRRVCQEWQAHPDALVLGSRRFVGKVPYKSRLGNAITRLVFHLATGVRVYDTQTGLRAFSVARVPTMLEMQGERYEYEINVLLYATRQKIPIREVEISTVYLDGNASSHFHPFRDAWRIYKMIFLFAASSLTAAVIDYGLVLLFSLLFRWSAQGLLISVILARVISSATNYVLNKQIVFEDYSPRSLFRYYMVAVGILAANYCLLFLLQQILPLALAKLLVEVILYPLSFILQRKFVFADRTI